MIRDEDYRRCRECERVCSCHPVADHRHFAPCRLQLGDLIGFVFRQYFGDDRVHSELPRYHLRRLTVVAVSITVSTPISCKSAPIDCLHINWLPYRRAPYLLKRVHQLIECLDELLDAFVFELLRDGVQINPHFT